MFDLTGKTALVTGASGDIGSAIARIMHAQGAHVIIHGTNHEKLQALAGQLAGNCTIALADMGERAQVQELAKTAEMADILVNNAGLTRDNLSLLMKEEEWDKVIEVNLTSIFFLSKAIAKQMMKRRYGRIINISSVVGVVGNGGQANYVASKAGLIGLSKTLAIELAPRGITVNAIAPGFIETNMTQKLKPEQTAALQAKIPLGRLGNSDDIAYSALYLASSEASYVTGTTIHVNGGMAMV